MKNSNQEKTFSIPKEVINISKTLKNNGFQAYLIGGCTRDLLLGNKPKDWDITTNAKPEEILKIFPDTFYENDYGTVGVVNREVSDETLKWVEITPYRLEAKYSDNRRPDSVVFGEKLDEDLKRRDFTINAIAIDFDAQDDQNDQIKIKIVDLFGGQEDLGKKIIKAVGNPEERFGEDALRILRAVRFSAQLGFVIETETEKAVVQLAHLLAKISKERIRDEFVKIIMSERPAQGLFVAQKLGVLKYIAPELEEGMGVEQGGEHIYDVWEHTMRALQHSADKKFPLEVRLAVLFHDVGKPKSRMKGAEKWTFYGHEVIGAKMAEKILEKLKFSKKTIEKTVKLVRWHMFFSDTEQITLSAVRRMLARVGEENIWDLINVRMCDRIGMGRPKEDPYRLRKYEAMIEEVMRDPVSVGMLKIDGNKIIELTKSPAGPKVGQILNALLEEALEDPKKNTEEYLNKRTLELFALPEKELKKLGEQGKEESKKENLKDIQEIRRKRGVK